MPILRYQKNSKMSTNIYCLSVEEALEKIKEFECNTESRFVCIKRPGEFGRKGYFYCSIECTITCAVGGRWAAKKLNVIYSSLHSDRI